MGKLVEGIDYYIEDGLYVFTAEHHLKRGYCCNSGCRHCPFPPGPATDWDDLIPTASLVGTSNKS